MGKIIRANVYVNTPSGETKFYEAGDEVPDEHAALITAPVWDKTDEPKTEDTNPGVTVENSGDIDHLNKKELTELAKTKGIELKGDETKEQLVELIKLQKQ